MLASEACSLDYMIEYSGTKSAHGKSLAFLPFSTFSRVVIATIIITVVVHYLAQLDICPEQA